MPHNGLGLSAEMENEMCKTATLRVVTIITSVNFDCPHCEESVDYGIRDWNNIAGSDYGDWTSRNQYCPHCGGEFEIDEIEWD